MPKNTRGYFFDLDGTLVDTHNCNCEAYYEAITSEVPSSVIDKSILFQHISKGENCRDFLKCLIPNISESGIQDIAERKAKIYPSKIPLSALNKELITQIHCWKKETNTIIALVTTAKRVNAERVLSYHGISNLFDYAIFGDEVEKLKPAPDIYIKALKETGLAPCQVEVFEDSEIGLRAAKAAGINNVNHITWTGAAVV